MEDFIGMTLAGARRALAFKLAAAGREPAELDARLLVEAATGFDHAALLSDGDRLLDPDASGRLAAAALRRIAGEPTSRIIGHRDFGGLTLRLHPGVLDPREDTETLVRLACRLRADTTRVATILDLGTGSGALLCALLAAFPHAWGVGVDRSMAACCAARVNLRSCGFAQRSFVVQGDWADALVGAFDLVVSNPPYIRTGDLGDLPDEVRHDPKLALDGGYDGFDAYRAILGDIGRIMASEGLAVFEIGAGMRPAFEPLARNVGLLPSSMMRDAGGHERAIAMRRL